MFIMEPKKENIELDIKKYEISTKEKIDILLRNYEFGFLIETLKLTKFISIDEFANNLVLRKDKVKDGNKDYLFTIKLEPQTINDLRKYLTKHKKFVFEYITSQNEFPFSHLYQLYLQYIPYELTPVEKSIFLDAYINMVTELRGDIVSDEKRKLLEHRLNIK